MLWSWALSFVLTLVTELPVAAWVLRHLPRPAWHVPAVAAAATGLTHPVFWWLLPRWFDHYWSYIVVGELGIIAVESLVFLALLRPVGWREAVRASAWMNGVSYLVGLGLRHVVGLG